MKSKKAVIKSLYSQNNLKMSDENSKSQWKFSKGNKLSLRKSLGKRAVHECPRAVT